MLIHLSPLEGNHLGARPKITPTPSEKGEEAKTGKGYERGFLPWVARQYYGGKEKEWEMASVCGLHRRK